MESADDKAGVEGNIEGAAANGKACDMEGNERVVINVSGLRFETQLKTLNLFPDTMLGDPERRNRYYDSTRNEYIIYRNRPSFDAILYYYQSGGQLLRPLNVPSSLFTEEIRFFELGDDALDKYREVEGLTKEESPPPVNGIMGKAWLLLEYPESSIAALIMAIVCACITLVFTIISCLETLPVFMHDKTFFPIKVVCILWFALESLVRFVCCPKKLEMLKSIMNLIEIVAIIPPLIAIPFIIIDDTGYGVFRGLMSIAILRSVSLIRFMRIFRASRQTLDTFGRAMKASVPDLCFILVILFIAVIIFSSAVYHAEADTADTMFQSVPASLWWTIVSLTTVGYGDIIPVSVPGRLVGSLCILVGGVLTIALPIVVVSTRFSYFYRKRMEQEYGPGNSTKPKSKTAQLSSEEEKL